MEEDQKTEADSCNELTNCRYKCVLDTMVRHFHSIVSGWKLCFVAIVCFSIY